MLAEQLAVWAQLMFPLSTLLHFLSRQLWKGCLWKFIHRHCSPVTGSRPPRLLSLHQFCQRPYLPQHGGLLSRAPLGWAMRAKSQLKDYGFFVITIFFCCNELTLYLKLPLSYLDSDFSMPSPQAQSHYFPSQPAPRKYLVLSLPYGISSTSLLLQASMNLCQRPEYLCSLVPFA